jgi:hypothetical protein
MRLFRFFAHADQTSAAEPAPPAILVPPGQQALVLRQGVVKEVYQAGLHPLPSAPGAVEIRLLESSHTRADAELSQGGAAALPYRRSWLQVDGNLVGMIVPSRWGAHSEDHSASQLSDWQ